LNIDLSEAQSVALQQLQEQLTQKPVCLLHGVTGSGKTQLFIRLMEQYFTAGKQVLYLLPEIALTAQMIRRLQAHFGGHIAIYHSKFSDNERVELWHKVRKGTVRIVLGARSALFLPFHDLGLIVVDEEHDPSFKQQEPAPRYHARDAAIYYGQLTGARVVLGSATPSLESYFHATRGKFGLVALLERFGGIQLPEIEFVNTRFLPSRGKVMISPRLREAMEKAIAAKKQVILFQNRRGYTPYLTCGTCGYIPQCQQCDVTLTFHKQSNKLQCHYCGTSYPKLVACPACGTVNWKDGNFGTEKIEEYLTKELADMRVARMDMDTIRGKHAHDQLIRQFEQGKVDVLVGTQMVVKGLDFEQVSLVGILDADSMLHFADFRVHERAFQLMEQVSGRAGRKSEQGKVLIQTAYPQHPVLQWVKQHDYVAFFEQEIGSRQQYHYPPFTRIIHIMVRHKDRMLTEQAADVLADLLRKDLGDRVMGPSVPVISRVRNQYRMELQIKLPLNQQFIQQAKQLIRNAQGLLQAETRFRSVIITPDVDPV
jgi:primosomal protein N' (replication factor Y)